MLKKKLIATIMTVVMALSLMAPAMAVDAPSKAPTPSTIYKIENIKKGSIQGRGAWKEGPTFDASVGPGGQATKEFSYGFSIEASANVSASDGVLTAAFGYTVGQNVSVSSSCTINVPTGKKAKIMYRGKYQVYTADQVLYRTLTGKPTQELNREKITMYIPVDIDFKSVYI